jgi:drug/metabolite transporter (DMT)-like permease
MGSSLHFIVAGTLVAGAGNSLLTKFQDNQCVRNCLDPDINQHRLFEQPALQSLQMFVGEFSVYLVYYFVYLRKRRDYVPLSDGHHTTTTIFDNIALAIPAVCDLLGTTLLNVGLVYTPVSIYQMTRGSIVLFVAILSVIFLKRKITKLEWISLTMVTLGIVIVGLSGSQAAAHPDLDEDPKLITVGILLIVLAELLQAGQFVIEEHILSKHPIVPLKLVYIEGFYGSTILVIVMVILNFILKSILPPKKFIDNPFNVGESFSQLFASKAVLVSSICIMISIATFNYCGISLTHRISATARSTVDTSRTLLVWLFALIMGWESFKWLQFLGFSILVFGTLCFNGVLEPELWSWVPKKLKDEVIHEVVEPVERF